MAKKINKRRSKLGEGARKSLHLFVLIDTSGSMKGDRIAGLNEAMSTIIPELKAAAEVNPMADLYFSVIEFSTQATWIHKMMPMDEVPNWKSVEYGGLTDLGAALQLVNEVMTPADMPAGLGRRNAPPVLVLLSDGYATDDWEKEMNLFEQTTFGKKSSAHVKVAIAIGDDTDMDMLERFTGNIEYVVKSNNIEQLKSYLIWATVTVSGAAASGMSQFFVSQVATEVWVVDQRKVTKVPSFDAYIQTAHARAEAA